MSTTDAGDGSLFLDQQKPPKVEHWRIRISLYVVTFPKKCRLYSSNNSSNKYGSTDQRLCLFPNAYFFLHVSTNPWYRNISTQCRSARLFPTVVDYTGQQPWRLNMSRYVVLIPDIPWDCLEIDVSILIVYLHMYIHINSSPQDPGLTFSH